MVDEEVIAEVEYYRDTFKTMHERADRLAKRLRSALPERVEYDRTQLDAPPRVAQPQRRDTPEPASHAAPHQNGGAELELDVETLHVADDGERKTFRVRGGAFRKWGVFIWPEVLERDFGIDSDNIKPGLHPFKYRVRILMDGDKPKKVVGIVQ